MESEKIGKENLGAQVIRTLTGMARRLDFVM